MEMVEFGEQSYTYVLPDVLVEYCEQRFHGRDHLKHEFGLAFMDFLRNGMFSVSVKRLDATYGQKARRRFKTAINECPYVQLRKEHVWWFPTEAKRNECRKYTFINVPGMEKIETKLSKLKFQLEKLQQRGFKRFARLAHGTIEVVRSGIEAVRDMLPKYLLFCDHEFSSIPGACMRDRANCWRDLCMREHWSLYFDYGSGVSNWGAATLASLQALDVPLKSSGVLASAIAPRLEMLESISKSKGKEFSAKAAVSWYKRFYRMASSGQFVGSCFRRHGRLYHPLVNMPKAFRHWLSFEFCGDVEPVAEVDMSTTYFTLLASMLDDECSEKERLINVLQNGDFYGDLRDYAVELGSKDVRLADRDHVKAECQKQLLFWIAHNNKGESYRPLWKVFEQRWPQLARLVDSYRLKMNGSEFSKILMELEASIFVDSIHTTLFHKLGIPNITIHDCVLVPSSCAEYVAEVCGKLAAEKLGFVPRFKIS